MHQNVALTGNGLTHHQTTNFRLCQTKKFADNNLIFNENGRKLSKQVEIEQFLLFPQCFQKACFPGVSKVSLCGNGLKGFGASTRILCKGQPAEFAQVDLCQNFFLLVNSLCVQRPFYPIIQLDFREK